MHNINNVQTRLAGADDLETVTALFNAATNNMIQQKIFQWDGIYPNRNDIKKDIEERQMYVCTIRNEIAATFVLNDECDELYKIGNWKYDGRYYVLHRLCVHPKFQHIGLAKYLMNEVFDVLRLSSVFNLRFDCFTQNPYSKKLYDSLGCAVVGTVDFRKGKFYLYEKHI